jgi:heptosyltransferase I
MGFQYAARLERAYTLIGRSTLPQRDRPGQYDASHAGDVQDDNGDLSGHALVLDTETAVQRILIVKTSPLAEIAHALPALTDIKAHFPDAAVDWLVEEYFSDIPAQHPGVDRVIPPGLQRWRHDPFGSATRKEIHALRLFLRQTPYDIVLDLDALLKSIWLVLMARGERHGFDSASVRAPHYDAADIRAPFAPYLYHRRHAAPLDLHAVYRYRVLAGAACGYKISGSPDYGLIKPQMSPVMGKLLCFHGSSIASKLWPESHWREVLEYFAGRGVHVILPWTGAEEAARATRLARGLHGIEVHMRQTLDTLAHWCGGALGVIGVDTGLTHLAAATGTPVVAIYCASDPASAGVIAGSAPVRNLGGMGRPPDVSAVLAAARDIFR